MYRYFYWKHRFADYFCVPWLLAGVTFITLLYTFTTNHLYAANIKNENLYRQLYEINQKQIQLHQLVIFLSIITMIRNPVRSRTIQLL